MPEQNEIANFMGMIAERTENILNGMKEIKEHLNHQNGTIDTHGEKITQLDTTVNGKEGLCNEVDGLKKNQIKLFLAVGAIAATIGGGISGLVKILG